MPNLQIVLMSICLVQAADSLQRASVAAQAHGVRKMQQPIEAQVRSVRRQVVKATALPEGSFFTLIEPTPASDAEAPGCAPLTEIAGRQLVERAALANGIEVDLLQAVVAQESAFLPCAVSSKGAKGLTQLMPATAASLGVQNPFDPEQNLNGGAKLLKQLLTRYPGDLNRVLGAYNAGTARVDAADGVPAFPETQGYVEKVISRYLESKKP